MINKIVKQVLSLIAKGSDKEFAITQVLNCYTNIKGIDRATLENHYLIKNFK